MALNLKKKSVEILRNFLFFPFKFCLTSKRHEAEIRINYKKTKKNNSNKNDNRSGSGRDRNQRLD